MRIKKFKGNNLPVILGKVKKEFGDEAVILSTKYPDKNDSDNMIEVTAAIDFEVNNDKSKLVRSKLAPEAEKMQYRTSFNDNKNEDANNRSILANQAKKSYQFNMLNSISKEKINEDSNDEQSNLFEEFYEKEQQKPAKKFRLFGRREKENPHQQQKENIRPAQKAVPQNNEKSRLTSTPAELKDFMEEIESFRGLVSELKGMLRGDAKKDSFFSNRTKDRELNSIWGDLTNLQWSLRFYDKEEVNSIINHPDEGVALFLRKLTEKLYVEGIEKTLVKNILEKITDRINSCDINEFEECVEALFEVLAGMINDDVGFWKNTNRDCQDRIALVGFTGVGKTTTVAKMASIFTQKKRQKTLMLSLDHQRIEVSDQLNYYGRNLGIPCETLLSPAMISKKLSNSYNYDKVFIDTVGTNEKYFKNFSELASFLASIQDVRKYLVIHSAIRDNEMLDAIRQFKKIGVSGLIFSKIDETNSFGSIFNLAAKTKLPVCCMTTGPTVPEDIALTSKTDIAHLLMNDFAVN